MTSPRIHANRNASFLALFVTVLLLALAVVPSPAVTAAPAQAETQFVSAGEGVAGAGLPGLSYACGYSKEPDPIAGGSCVSSNIYPTGAPDNAIVAYMDINNVTMSGPGAGQNAVRYCPAGSDLSDCVALSGADNYFVSPAQFVRRGVDCMTVSAGQQRVPVDYVAEHTVALPPMELQQQNVADLAMERALIAANGKLVEVFEKKIQDRLAEVWGAGG